MNEDFERAIAAARGFRESWTGRIDTDPKCDGARAFAASILSEVERSSGDGRENHAVQVFKSVLSQILTGDYKSAKQILSQRRLDPQLKSLTIATINEVVLADRSLEWTSHGVRASFRFWPQKRKENYVAAANEAVEYLKSLSEYTCLGFGSVLSVYRDHDLNPHDDDLDLIVAFKKEQVPTIREGLVLATDHLEKKGYTVSGDFFNHRHTRKSGFRLDVFIGLIEENNRVGWFPGARANLHLTEVFPALKHDIFGIPCDIPAQPETYLARVYGESWRQPIAGWQHARNRASYRDIL